MSCSEAPKRLFGRRAPLAIALWTPWSRVARRTILEVSLYRSADRTIAGVVTRAIPKDTAAGTGARSLGRNHHHRGAGRALAQGDRRGLRQRRVEDMGRPGLAAGAGAALDPIYA